MSVNIEELKQKLLNEDVTVKFTKADGSVRTMLCTLNKDKIPAPDKEPVNQKRVRELSDQVVVVWDLEKQGWRSFRVDRFISAS